MKRQTLLAASLLASSAAMAQKSALPTDVDTTLIYQLQNIEVKATRVDRKVPVAHTNLSGEDIQRNNYGKDIPSMLQLTPSIVCTSDAGNGIGYSDIRLRGNDGTRINVTANGVPMNDAESHKLYWVDTPDLMSSVGTMQIQRGTGTSTNGAGAFGGSINMTTAPLPTKAGGEASLSYGSYTTNKEALRLSSGILGNHWAFDGRFSHIYSHGYMDRAFSNLSSYMLQGAYYGENTVVKLIAFGGHERTYNAWDGLTKDQMAQRRTYNPCGEITDADDKVVGFYENQTDNYTQNNYQLVMNHVFNEHWNLNATAHYTRGHGYYNQWKNNKKLAEYYVQFNDEAGNPIKKSNLIRKKQMENDFGGIVSSANYQADRIHVSLGGAWNIYDGDHFGNLVALEKVPSYNENKEYYRNSATKTDMNFFAKANWELADGLNLFGDLQYRRIQHKIHGKNSSWSDSEGDYQTLNLDNTYNFFNPKAGINYTCGEHTVYASFGIGQKEPNRDDFTNAMNGKEPKAEKMYDWEAGYQFGNSWLQGCVNLYWMQYHNQLIATGAINTDTYDVLYFNQPDSYRRGVEVTASVKLLPCLTLSGNATWSQNKIKNYTESIYSYNTWDNEERQLGSTRIAYSPDLICGGMLRFSKKGFDADLNLQHVGKQYINNSEKDELSLDAYTVTNLNLAYTLPMKGIKSVRFGLSISNLFNKKYCSNAYVYDAGTSAADGDWYDVRYFPQATRNVLANLTVNF